jgi:uncharacterized DUF497 family protein
MRANEFDWDARKAKRNDQQHGVTFELAQLAQGGRAFLITEYSP